MEIKSTQEINESLLMETEMKICIVCKKETPLVNARQIANHLPASFDFPIPSGGIDYYCNACYKDTFKTKSCQPISQSLENHEYIGQKKKNTKIMTNKFRCKTCNVNLNCKFNYCPYCGTIKSYSGEIKDPALIILNCLNNLRANCGRSLLRKILLASKDKYVLEELSDTEFFGALRSKYSSYDVLRLIDDLIDKGYIETYKSESAFRRPLIKLSEKGKSAI